MSVRVFFDKNKPFFESFSRSIFSRVKTFPKANKNRNSLHFHLHTFSWTVFNSRYKILNEDSFALPHIIITSLVSVAAQFVKCVSVATHYTHQWFHTQCKVRPPLCTFFNQIQCVLIQAIFSFTKNTKNKQK